ncbi:hypothetical protein [Xanthomonas sp. 3307]|uniref:hypothetical protein n=1 Tax=Xanthomonas sp. 3307 TaxID=3035316 RepID=UPI00161D4364|nr:hypothetical protein [Xanthomonas sp. 3307]MBB5942485.1 hypothetical protein [Xanthomonas sp. 3307]
MTETPDPKTQALYDMTRQWLGRELSEEERAQLRAFAASTQGTPQATNETPNPAASSRTAEIERTRQRIDAARRSADSAIRDGDQAAHDAIAAAAALELALPKGHADPHLDGATSVGQQADFLADTIRRQVKEEVDRQFAALAQQMQAVVGTARAQGPIAPPPSSVGMVFGSAVSGQQQSNKPAQASLQEVGQTHGPGATAGAVEKIAQAGAPDNLASLLVVLQAFKNNTPPKS